uniref:Uncharacterized protein n=1 Tax=Chromera velia CCMP2878 TaxID=1169474 RepID=A0A0G4FDK1_9ALVE|eukprot:Cvel_16369.t1-p1 / transcript=Cvel_16369.t1 / gene=Cvel_16369 / organism=Chromera_velia_CCMP2878 / gene_product=hypothetical protein / transcript_product=hypothetical protein / location=Cvel_scaffold1258:10161-19564(+) / protein_length=386 / sequence_SO=supercontig / SO=protein_coding / is_pseudo=false
MSMEVIALMLGDGNTVTIDGNDDDLTPAPTWNAGITIEYRYGNVSSCDFHVVIRAKPLMLLLPGTSASARALVLPLGPPPSSPAGPGSMLRSVTAASAVVAAVRVRPPGVPLFNRFMSGLPPPPPPGPPPAAVPPVAPPVAAGSAGGRVRARHCSFRLPKPIRLTNLREQHRQIARDCRRHGEAFIIEGPTDLHAFSLLDFVLEEHGHLLGMKGWRVLRKVMKATGKENVQKMKRVFDKEGVEYHALIDSDAKKQKAMLEDRAFQWGEDGKDLERSLGKKKKGKGKKKKSYYAKPADLLDALFSADSPWQDFLSFLREKGVIDPAPPGMSKWEPIDLSDSSSEDEDGEDDEDIGGGEFEEEKGESKEEEKSNPDWDRPDRSEEDEQ